MGSRMEVVCSGRRGCEGGEGMQDSGLMVGLAVVSFIDGVCIEMASIALE